MRQYLEGEEVRDWRVNPGSLVVYPYGTDGDRRSDYRIERLLWSSRTSLANRVTFQGVMADAGRCWWEYMQHTASAYSNPLGINFANVATHNHYSLTRGGMIFNAHAPVIKLREGASAEEYLAILAVLNSSTACFWLKQHSHNKGEGGGARVDAGYAARGEPFRETYEFNGATLQDYPLPKELPIELGRAIDALGRELQGYQPQTISAVGVPSSEAMALARDASERVKGQMIALQDELDWETYRLYGLIDESLNYEGEDIPALALGERAFEIALARSVESGREETTWFTHPEHRSTPITAIPARWPIAYRELVQRRLDIIASTPSIKLLERPEYKRRWAQEPWEKRQERALRGWLLDRLEDRRSWFDPQGRPLPRSVAQLADEVSRDADMVSVLALWEGRPDVPVTQSLVRLLADEAVPFLAAYRYKDSGLRKREAWEQTWALQRREDAGEHVGTVPVPPKYSSADFRKTSYWQARGKLDVPKERFILYPNAGRETDPTPLLGWAGWDHAQQSLALSLIIGERERDGWTDERLIPLVAGLAELQPWVEQWHSEVDPGFGVSLAAFCREQLTARAAQVGKTLDELAGWRPAPATRGRRPRSAE
jgi:uncharacterized protein DUF7008